MEYFKLSDFRCKCDRPSCDAIPISPDLLDKLVSLRKRLGEAIVILSACRCLYWNNKVNGADNSQHLLGKAVDVRVKNAAQAARFVIAALVEGFTGFGISNKGFVHLDIRDGDTVFFGY